MARSEMTGYSFLVHLKITNSDLKIPVANISHLIIPQTHPEHGRCVASWNFNCVWFF